MASAWELLNNPSTQRAVRSSRAPLNGANNSYFSPPPRLCSGQRGWRSFRVGGRTRRDCALSAKQGEGLDRPREGFPEKDSIVYQTLQFEPYEQTEKPTVRVRFSVPFRCHSRQMLCMGGSQFPFGWSFVSIAKVPMTWNPKDLWTAEVELPVGLRLEYKYVILEEQVWTKQEDEESEGVVELKYRTGNEPGQPPDVQTIRKQMAIVDWQPGPNRVLEVPSEQELARLEPGDAVQRTPARPRPFLTFRKLENLTPTNSTDPFEGTWEELVIDEDGTPILFRRDVWPYKGASLSFEEARRLFLGDS